MRLAQPASGSEGRARVSRVSPTIPNAARWRVRAFHLTKPYGNCCLELVTGNVPDSLHSDRQVRIHFARSARVYAPAKPGRRIRAKKLQRYVPVLLRRILVPLRPYHLQSLNQFLASLARLDDRIHKSAIRRYIRIRKPLAKFFDLRP